MTVASPQFAYRTKSNFALDIPASEAAIEIEPKLMACTAVISTPALDRQGEVLSPAGLILDDYTANPVVLYDHRKSWPLPIGIAEDESGNCTVQTFADGKIKSRNFFSQTCQFSNQVFRLIDENILRGWSVGFDPLEAEPIGMRPDGKGKSFLYNRWKLVEQSVTPTGVNPEALTIYVEKSMVGSEPMLPQLVKALAPFKLPGREWSNGATLKLKEKSMADLPGPAGSADELKKPPEQKADDSDSGGKRLKPSAQKLLDSIQAVMDAATAMGTDLDILDHEDVAADLAGALDSLKVVQDELTASLKTHHPDVAKAVDVPDEKKVHAPDKKPDDKKDDTASDKKDDAPKKDEKKEYEKSFERGALVVKGYNYVPRRLRVTDKSSTNAESELSPEEEAEAKAALRRINRDLRYAERARLRAG